PRDLRVRLSAIDLKLTVPRGLLEHLYGRLARLSSVMTFCTECGNKLIYDRETRMYVCPGCGFTYTTQDLLLEKEKRFNSKFEEDKKRRKREEYLEWWLSSKT
ncbi:MAG: hypothetical protein QXF95_08435, partial [Candidatus Caldarchaeum sp.]